MTPGRLLYLVQRDWKRGVAATWNERFVSGRILGWRNPFAKERAGPVPVRVLTGKDDWLLACWMLASWFHATGRNWTVVIHDDGRLPPEAYAAFREMIPGVAFVRAAEGDQAAARFLAGHPACSEYRLAHPFGRKIFDFTALTTGDRFLSFDSDILFFRKPEVLLKHCDEDDAGCWFNEDVSDSLPISHEEAREKLGFDIWPRVNAGMCLIDRAAIDLDLCERALRETSILQGHPWLVEQALYAICASARGLGGLLPPEYEVSLEKKARPGVVARHYVGAVRQHFHGEGMARLKSVLLS